MRTDAARHQQLSLSASGDVNDSEELQLPDSNHESERDSFIPPFVEVVGKQQSFHLDISRLEAIYDMESELFCIDDKSNGISQRLLSSERVILLGDWMKSDEGKCSGDYCGDEFDVSTSPSLAHVVNLRLERLDSIKTFPSSSSNEI